jgi:hypothetical protein
MLIEIYIYMYIGYCIYIYYSMDNHVFMALSKIGKSWNMENTKLSWFFLMN